MKLSQLLEEKRKAKKRQAMAKTAKTVGLTAVIGASVGALGGVLLAPKSGKETRDDIKNSAIDANEKLKVKATEAKEKFNENLATSKENLSEANNKIKEYLKNKKSAKNSEVQAQIEAVSEIKEVATTESEEVQA